jgi:hypothetical protein
MRVVPGLWTGQEGEYPLRQLLLFTMVENKAASAGGSVLFRHLHAEK